MYGSMSVATTHISELSAPRSQLLNCFHCATRCARDSLTSDEKVFCCQGCLTVYELLSQNGLTEFYGLENAAGVRVQATREHQFQFVDEPQVLNRLVEFQDERVTRVTFHLPAIHCIACVWLLENLYRLKPGIGSSRVNFPRKEVTILFENARVKLSEIIELLASLGYEPDLRLSDVHASRVSTVQRELWLQLGLAGFSFGNLMLLAIGVYFGVDAFSGPFFRKLAGYFGLLLSIPVVTYSANYYWRTAWHSVKQRRLAIEVPIAAGIVAIFGESAYQVLSGTGEGYFDSLCGLIFFLLCGRLFQQKSFDRLNFERDYKAFFPLAVTRRSGNSEGQVALDQLQIGDTLTIRHGELIPADSKLISDAACVDYSFVTGESEPVQKRAGDYLYAGGRQMSDRIEVETVKRVSQSYLALLWNQEAFRKDKHASFETLINAYSYRFTLAVMLIALGAALFWAVRNPANSIKAFTSVLIVACPCALALAAPFTLGSAFRQLGRVGIFIKNGETIEALAKINAIVFDKTGTLTAAGAESVVWRGATGELNARECLWLYSIAQHSTHPLAVRIAQRLASETAEPVRSFHEKPGRGIEGVVDGTPIVVGSALWLQEHAISPADNSQENSASMVHVGIGGQYRGCFLFQQAFRHRAAELVSTLSTTHELTLLSGDNARQRDTFAQLFGERTVFDQSPLEKLEFVRQQQRLGKRVMMVGDGLNDAGALKQSDVGVAVVENAVVENVSAFSPASDVIMQAARLPDLDRLLRFSKRTIRIVRLSFLLSTLYNVIGISIAASAFLSPVVCAVLMPLSSVSVVLFACSATSFAARGIFGPKANVGASAPIEGESVHTL
jgi:P-type Cu+ transporter